MYESRGTIRGLLTSAPINALFIFAVLVLYGHLSTHHVLDSMKHIRKSLVSEMQKDGMPKMQIYAIESAVDQASQTTFAAAINMFYVMAGCVAFAIGFPRLRARENAKATPPDKTGSART